MSTIIPKDEYAKRLKAILSAYENKFPCVHHYPVEVDPEDTNAIRKLAGCCGGSPAAAVAECRRRGATAIGVYISMDGIHERWFADLNLNCECISIGKDLTSVFEELLKEQERDHG